jgi:hypothetical protein
MGGCLVTSPPAEETQAAFVWVMGVHGCYDLSGVLGKIV